MEQLFKEEDIVWHKKLGAGRVALSDVGSVLVEFEGGNEELFELSAKKEPPVRKLRPEGFVVRLRTEPDTVKALAESDPVSIVTALHDDFGIELDADKIRKQVAGKCVDEAAWDEWWKKALPLVKADPRFIVEKNKISYRGDLVSIADGLLTAFKRAHNLKEKQKVCRDILKMETQGVPVEDAREAAITFFSGTAANVTNNIGARLEALLFLKGLDPSQYEIEKTSLYERIGAMDVQESAEALAVVTDNTVRRELLAICEELLPDLFIDIASTLTKRFRKTQRDWILDTLLEYGNDAYIKMLMDATLKDIPTNQQPFIWLTRKILESPDKLLKMGYDPDLVVRRMFKLLLEVHITSAFSADPKEGPSVSREEDELRKLLLKKDSVITFLKKHPENIVRTFCALYLDNSAIQEEDRAEMLAMLKDKFPQIDFAEPVAYADEDQEFALTREAFDRYEQELKDLVELKLPEVTQAIKTAREWGDIKENAEYHAAKEKQGLLMARKRTLERMLETAKVLD